MPLFCWFYHFLDSRAEICQIFRLLFGKLKTSQRHSEIKWPLTRFWNEICILLQEMRDRLKEKHKKNDMVKLKKQLQFGGDFGASFDSGFKMKGVAVTGAASSDFFDDWLIK